MVKARAVCVMSSRPEPVTTTGPAPIFTLLIPKSVKQTSKLSLLEQPSIIGLFSFDRTNQAWTLERTVSLVIQDHSSDIHHKTEGHSLAALSCIATALRVLVGCKKDKSGGIQLAVLLEEGWKPPFAVAAAFL